MRYALESEFKTMKKETKQEIYARYNIQYKDGYIFAPIVGWIKPLIKDGNTKTGKKVKTFSTLPTNETFHINIGTDENPLWIDIKGTCPCHCKGCYATKGNFQRFPDVKKGLAIITFLCYYYLDFVNRACRAQIEADRIKDLRLHAAGDFFSLEYVEMWRSIKQDFALLVTWTYTKVQEYESAFDDVENANIVKSIIPGHGFNFGHCDYILKTYYALKEAGKKVYICRCGIDKNQHCENCKGCSINDYVLFIEHSTEYKAESDPLFETLKALIESQAKPE